MNNFRVELTDGSAKKEALLVVLTHLSAINGQNTNMYQQAVLLFASIQQIYS